MMKCVTALPTKQSVVSFQLLLSTPVAPACLPVISFAIRTHTPRPALSLALSAACRAISSTANHIEVAQIPPDAIPPLHITSPPVAQSHGLRWLCSVSPLTLLAVRSTYSPDSGVVVCAARQAHRGPTIFPTVSHHPSDRLSTAAAL